MGAGLGLYLSRVLAEFGPLYLTAIGVVVSTVATVALAIASLIAARRRLLTLSPLVLCYAYVLYPRIHPDLALTIALIVSMALIVANLVDRLRHLPWELIVAVAGLTLYWYTLAPTLLPADSGEYQLVSRTLGIAHPPGYPLYTLLGRAFTLLPLGDAAYRVNLMSAVLAALTLAVIVHTVRVLTDSSGSALIAVLTLAVAPTFWAQATTANIRSLTALFTALLLLVLIRRSPIAYRRSLMAYRLLRIAIRNSHSAICNPRSAISNLQSPKQRLRCPNLQFALIFGLAVTHHGSLLFLALPFGLYLLLTVRRELFDPRLLLRMAGAFLLGCSPLLYLPLRGAMDAPLNPGGLTTVNGFLNHVLARGFRGDVFYFTSLSVLPDRLAVLENILQFQFGLPLLALALLGAIVLVRRQSATALLIGGAFVTNALVAITYRAPQTVEYLMPAYVALALLVGYGASVLVKGVGHRTLRTILVAFLLLPGIGNLRDNYRSFATLSQDTSTRDYVVDILQDTPEGATILSNWHYATAFWYLQIVEGVRPDVPVRYVAPQGAEPIGQTWRNRLLQATEQGPVVVTNRYNEYAGVDSGTAGLPYRPTPFHGAFLVGTAAAIPVDARRADVTFGGRFRLLGYQWSGAALSPGSPLTVRLYWQPLADADRDYAFFVHLADGTGRVWGQYDRTHQADELIGGEIRVDEAVLPLLPTVPPGTYNLLTGVYIPRPEGGWQRLDVEGGGNSLVLGQVEVQEATDPPVTAHRLYQPFQGGSALIGVDYDTSRPEGQRVYLHWRADGRTPVPPEQQEGYEARLSSGGNVIASAVLPPLGQTGHLTTALDVPTGSERLMLSLHRGDGAAVRALGPWGRGVSSTVSLPHPQKGARRLSFGGEMALTRAVYRVDDVNREVIVDLRWEGLRPLVHDYSVSVQLVGQGWRAQDDSTPALGAIPTLKWLPGTTITDRHRVKLPANASGPASLRVSVYDAFTLESLVILDDRLLKLGQGQSAELGTVTMQP